MTVLSPEERVRKVAHYLALEAIGEPWPLERIARQLHVSLSTVKRDKRAIETGPQPVLPAAPLAAASPVPDEDQAPARARVPAAAVTLLAAAVLLIAGTAGAALLIRALHPAPAAYQLCVRYGARVVTGIAGGGCPPGWQSVTLTPGGTP